MRRFLSWLVAALLSFVFYYVEYYFWVLVLLIAEAIRNISDVFFWVLIVAEGGTALGVGFLLVVAASKLVVAASQRVWRSKKASRYTVLGIFTMAFFAIFTAILLFASASFRGNKVLVLLAFVTMIVYGLFTMINGFSAVESDGAPPTKREILEEKLRKLDENKWTTGNEPGSR